MFGDDRRMEVSRRLDEVAGALSDLGDALAREEDLGLVLQRSISQVAAAIPAADMVSVTVLRDSKAETVASTSERVWAIDSDQYAAGDGPCLEAARTGEIVRVSVETAWDRWPVFARSARAAGVESYLSAPLPVDEKFAGSLNLYSEQAHGFDELDEKLLRLYVAAAVAAIASERRYVAARTAAENLRRALDSRAVIDQAIGVLMATRDIDASEAFRQISRESQNTNVRVREIAARVLETLGDDRNGRQAGR
jgi:GAF domain-containing protein